MTLGLATQPVDEDGRECLEYRGVLLGFEDVFEAANFRYVVSKDLIKSIDYKWIDEKQGLLSLLYGDNFIADEIILHEQKLPGDITTLVGSITDDKEAIDITIIDDPVSLAIIAVIGALVLICLAKLGVSTWLIDRADRRRADKAFERSVFIIDGRSEGEFSVDEGKPKARMRCGFRAEIREGGKVVEAETFEEELKQ